MKLRTAVLFLAAASAAALGQGPDPVQFAVSSDVAQVPPGATVPLQLTAAIEPGWHIYSLTVPQEKGQPQPSSVKIAGGESFQIHQPAPIRKVDQTIQLDTEMFEESLVLWAPVRLAADASGTVDLIAEITYQACDDKRCLFPKKKSGMVTVAVDASAKAAPFTVPAGFRNIEEGALSSGPSSGGSGNEGIVQFAAIAFAAGLAAIFTPCVFPMIPITVSYFINQKGGVLHAAVFALGIVTLFCAMGLGVTALAGPFGVIAMSSSPWVNTFIAVVFAVFATSLLGAFEITVPSGVLTKLDSMSRGGGLLGPLLMGLTFSLTSFACVGPFVGPLLAASVQAEGARPVIGMAGFATGLASPFFVLAAFPSVLKKMPKSGGWLARVKVVMGFVLLAVMFKYLSNIDLVLQTNILTRERFLVIWAVLFFMPALYLLGWLPLEGVERGKRPGFGRLLTAILFAGLSVMMVRGIFGAPLGELDAFVPANTGESGPSWMKDEYEQALARGRAENKLVLVNFTGYTCTNCHWMKANIFPRGPVADALGKYVRVELYIDGRDAVSEQYRRLQEEKFETAQMPYFVVMDADQNVLATFDRATRDAGEFLQFLQSI